MPIPAMTRMMTPKTFITAPLVLDGRLQVRIIGLPRIHFVAGQAGLQGVDHGGFLAELFQRNHYLGGLPGQAVQVLGFCQ